MKQQPTPTTPRRKFVFTSTHPDRTPFAIGARAFQRSQSMRGCPFGPGHRQDNYIRGFKAAAAAAEDFILSL